MMHLLLTLQGLVSERLERNDDGATAVEYGLLVALIAAIIVGVVQGLGIEIRDAFTDVANAIP